MTPAFNKYLLSLLLLFMLLHPGISPAQKKFKLMLTIKVEKDDHPLEGAILTGASGSRVFFEQPSYNTGLVYIDLNLNGEYELSVSSPHCITKKISVSTKLPPRKNNSDYEFPVIPIVLFEKVPGGAAGAEILNKPVLKISFDEKVGEFTYDKAYSEEIKKQVASLSAADRAKMLAEAEAKARGDIEKKQKAIADSLSRSAAENEKKKKEAEEKENLRMRAEKEKQEAEAKARVEVELKAFQEAERLKKEALEKIVRENAAKKSEVMEKIERSVAESELQKKEEIVADEKAEALKKEAEERSVSEQIKIKTEVNAENMVRVKREAAKEEEIRTNRRVKYEKNNPVTEMLRIAREYDDQMKPQLKK